MGLLLLAVVFLVLFHYITHYLTGQASFGVRKDGSGVNGEVKNNMNELQGNDKVLHDNPDYDRTLL